MADDAEEFQKLLNKIDSAPIVPEHQQLVDAILQGQKYVRRLRAHNRQLAYEKNELRLTLRSIQNCWWFKTFASRHLKILVKIDAL